MNQHKGVTLIELLVVTAILAILAAVIFPIIQYSLAHHPAVMVPIRVIK